jgi:hypothetical protein
VDVNALTVRHKQIGLHWAAYGGHLDIVTALLKRAPKLDAKTRRFGATPLGWAMHGWWEKRARRASVDDGGAQTGGPASVRRASRRQAGLKT